MNRALAVAVVGNLAWIVPTTVLTGAPLWACLLLPGMALFIPTALWWLARG